jgi:hypothetical protein
MTGSHPKDASTGQSNSGLKDYDEGKQSGQQSISHTPSAFISPLLDSNLPFGPRVYISRMHSLNRSSSQYTTPLVRYRRPTVSISP